MKHRVPTTLPIVVILAALTLIACGRESKEQKSAEGSAPSLTAKATAASFDPKRIKHVIVIYQENWSFDGLYSQFRSEGGRANGYTFGAPVKQFDAEGKLIDSMGLPTDASGRPFTSSKWKGRMPVIFYNLRDFDAPPNPYTDSSRTNDPTHRFYHHQRQINGGANDQFLYWSDTTRTRPNGLDNMNALALSGVDASNYPVGKLAQEYVMCDNTFQSAYGGSFLNHQWLIAARMPVFYNAKKDPQGSKGISKPESKLPGEWDSRLSATPADKPDNYYAINTVQPPFPPSGKGLVLPPQKHATIGDRLDDAKVAWKWYAQGWDAMADTMGGEEIPFQYHHQPFNYFEKFNPKTAEGAANRRTHLVDLDDFFSDLADGELPGVSFIKYTNEFNEHPYDAAVLAGDSAVADLVTKVMKSDAWNDCAIIITYDENGGRWDHVKPPKSTDGFGPGSRIPMIIISPYAKRGYIDHTEYETVSILKFIESIWGLEPLTERDRNANNLLNAFTMP